MKLLFLEDGAQSGPDVARWLAAIVKEARATLDLAIYDFHLEGEAADVFIGALKEREEAGVAVRVVYDAHQESPEHGIVVEPGHPGDTGSFITGAALDARPVGATGGRSPLMHHKFILVDAATPDARLWTGSANLTMAAFTRQENNLLDIASPALVAAYARDFEELWATGTVYHSGEDDVGRDVVSYEGEDASIEARFAPGEGAEIDLEVARRIEDARRDVTVASAVLSSGHILGALRDAVTRRVRFSGVVDLSAMGPILRTWSASPESSWKARTFDALARRGTLHGKASARNFRSGPHDYMHNKVIVVDDLVITGSYNFSGNARTNAENILFIQSPKVASAYRAYIARLMKRYPPV